MKLQHFFHILLAGAATGFITFTSFLPTVRAETTITDGYLQADTAWVIENSPYILSDVVTVPEGITLTVEPGVEIIAAEGSEYDPYIYVNGSLIAQGAEDVQIKFGDIYGVTIDHGKADISHSVFNMKGSLSFVVAEGNISSSTITNSADGIISDGISAQNSVVTIQGSTIEGNSTGIKVEDSGGIFQVRSDEVLQALSDKSSTQIISSESTIDSVSKISVWDFIIPKLERIGLVHIAHAIEFGPSQVTIMGSRLVDNSQAAILNMTDTEVHAANNWWGSESGPQEVSRDELIGEGGAVPNAVSGPVVYNPWLTTDPVMLVEEELIECCSSVIFIPGLQATRLYRNQPGPLGMGTSENQLWEPNRNADVEKLFLNPDGTSIDAGIFAGDPIGNAYGMVGVYDSFMEFLDDLTDEGKIVEWKSFGYDWRKPITEVVAGETVRATTTELLIQTVEEVAERSKTGKVSVIAHSNGGLATKYLVKTLAEMGKEYLIDKVISVAVPHIGTPQSIPALLHGDNQSILGGVVLKKSIAKELGLNMPSAYGLLPSATYFSKILGPTIAYASTATATPVTSANAQNSFISSRANSILMNAAIGMRSLLDPFTWPTAIARWAIVGWGNMTTKGIRYTNDGMTEYDKLTTTMGDGTVVAPSAAYNAGTTTAVDLIAVSIADDKTIKHSNILEAIATQEVIKNIVTGEAIIGGSITTGGNIVGGKITENSKAIEDAISKIPGVSIGELDYDIDETFLVVSTHSPVELHVYDSKGRHSGIAPLPPEIAEQVEEGFLSFIEENIPGSNVDLQGDEEDPTTYITIPEKGGQIYRVEIKGIGVGEFTYKVERTDGDKVIDSVIYSELPVTPVLVASSTVSTKLNNETGYVKLASSTLPLHIDSDGNGTIDTIAKPDVISVSPGKPTVFDDLRMMITQLLGSSKRAETLLKRVSRIEQAFNKNKPKVVDRRVERLQQVLDKFVSVTQPKKLAKISEKDRKQAVEFIEVYIAQFE